MALTTVNSGGIKDDSIVNADIKSDAAIALSKLASTPAVLTGSTNNTITTVTAANTIQGEANLTYDGSTLGITRGDSGTLDAVKITNSDTTNNGLVVGVNSSEEAFLWNGSNSSMNFATNNAERLRIDSSGRLLAGTTTPGDSGADDLTIATSGGTGITIRSGDTSNGSIYFSDGTSGAPQYAGFIQYNHGSDNKMYFGAGSSTRFQVESNGNVKVNDGDLVIGTAGHGIDFSAQTQSTSTTGSEVLNHYEEGTWTPINKSGQSVDGVAHNGAFNIGGGGARYTRIGNTVHICVDTFTMENTGGNYGFVMGGLPFTNVAVNRGLGDLVTTDAQAHKGLIVSNTSYIYFYPENSTTASTNAQVSQAVIYGITGTYTV